MLYEVITILPGALTHIRVTSRHSRLYHKDAVAGLVQASIAFRFSQNEFSREAATEPTVTQQIFVRLSDNVITSYSIHYTKLYEVFCYRDVFGFRTDKRKAYRIGYAISKDGQNWIRKDEGLNLDVGINEEWDSDVITSYSIHYTKLYEFRSIASATS